MTHESEVEAERWVDVLVDSALEFVALHGTKQGLGLRETAASGPLLLRLLLFRGLISIPSFIYCCNRASSVFDLVRFCSPFC